MKLVKPPNRREEVYGSRWGFWDNSSKANKIKIDDVTRYNPNVPKELSEVIYHMTHHDKKQRAKVFSELFVLLKNFSKKKS